MTFKNILLAGTALGAAAILAGPAFAGSSYENDAVKAQIEALQQQIDDMKIQYGNELKDLKEKQEAVQVGLKDGRPTFKTGDGLFTFAIRGRAHLDMAAYNQSEGDKAKGGNTTLDGGENFRRAELGIEGTFLRDWGYKLNIQFGDSGAEKDGFIKDAFMSYNGFKPFGADLALKVGAIQTPMTLDDSTSSNDITFMERATAANLATSLGAGDGRMSYGAELSTGMFYVSTFYTTEVVTATANTSNEGSNIVARLAANFQPMDKTNVHVGASGTYGTDVQGTVRYRDRPELRVDANRLVDTGAIAADESYVYGPELAASYGPVKLQGEYYVYTVDRKGALSDVDFNSWYVQASWVITGEAYKYDKGVAAYKGVKPDSPFTPGGGIGAFELAARYSETDLNDANIFGGKQDIWTVGLNWYANNNVRLMLNYLNVDVEDRVALNNNFGHDAYAARLQFAF